MTDRARARRLRSVAGVAAISAFVVACAAKGDPIDERTNHAPAAIVGGALDSDDPAVVAIVGRRKRCDEAPPTPFCSGTLVAPRVVLTAAHCVQDAQAGVALEVMLGRGDDDPRARFVVVTYVALHPSFDPATNAHDVALLRLAEDPGVAPIPVAASFGAVTVGATARVVGFGVDGDAASVPGTKRTGTTKVDAIDATTFRTVPSPSMTCVGDSGGPVLVGGGDGGAEELVGVTSKGDRACMQNATNARVDVELSAFVTPFVNATAASPSGRPNGVIALAALCTASCATSADCPAALACIAGFHGGTCGLLGAPPSAFGASCARDAECGAGASCARLWPTGSDACACATPCAGAPVPPSPSGSASASAVSVGGGCAVASARGTPLAPSATAWVTALVVSLLRRRHRRSRRVTTSRAS